MFFFLLFLLSLTASEATYCAMPEDETLYIYPNQKNCSTFIACIGFEEYEFDCVKAPLFIPWSSESLCVEECASVETTKKITSKPNYQLPPDPLLYPDTPARTLICPPQGKTNAVVAQSCSDFIECDNGIGTKTKCPDGEEFSPTKYKCVPKDNSDCSKQKEKGSFNIKCRYDKGGSPTYFQSDSCSEFKKCANQMAWNVKCAHYCHWNNERKTCDWAKNFDCRATNQ